MAGGNCRNGAAAAREKERRKGGRGGRRTDQKEKEGSPREGESTNETRMSPQWRPFCTVKLRCLCTTGWGRRYCSDRPWRATEAGLCESLLASAETIGHWDVSSRDPKGKLRLGQFLPCCHFLTFSIRRCLMCLSLQHKYAIAAVMTGIVRDPIGRPGESRGRWVRDGLNKGAGVGLVRQHQHQAQAISGENTYAAAWEVKNIRDLQSLSMSDKPDTRSGN